MVDKKKILVLGGTGFIGSNLLYTLDKDKFEVMSISMNLSKFPVENVTYIHDDINNLSDKNLIKIKNIDFHYIINLSGYIDHSLFKDRGNQSIENHFIALTKIIKILSRKNLKLFLQVGSSDEYGNMPAPQHENYRESPISPYSLAKVAATHFLQMLYRTEKFPSAIFRLFLTYGPRQDKKRFLPQIISSCLNDATFDVSEGQQLRDFCYIDDVIQAILLALDNPNIHGEVLNIASGQPISVREVTEFIQLTIGKGYPEYGKIKYRPGENMKLFANIDKAKRILGWEPRTSFEEGIRKTIEWFKYHN